MSSEHVLDPEIEVRFAAHRLLVPLRALAARLGLPDAALRGVLLALLLDPRARAGAASACPGSQRHGHGAEGGGRGREERDGRDGTNEPTKQEIFSETKTKRFVAREAGEIHSPELLVPRIAALLGDTRGLRTYAKLAERHPPELLLRALDRALRAPAGRIRRTRGAYFMGVVANLAKNQTPYDRTHPPAA